MNRSESIKEIAAALAKAQAKIRNAAQDKTNPAFRSKYADLASVWEACRQHLSDNGIAVVQAPAADGPKVTVTTMLVHVSGEWMSADLTITAVKPDPQGIGSAVTYARRYGLASMVGVAPGDDIADAGDDDANEASGKTQPRTNGTARPDQSAKIASLRNAVRDPKVRSAAVLALAVKKYGGDARAKIAHVIGRTLPVEGEVVFTEEELGKLEPHAALVRATDNAEAAAH